MNINEIGDVLVKCKYNIPADPGNFYECSLGLASDDGSGRPNCKLSRYSIGDTFKCNKQSSFYVSWTEYLLYKSRLIEVDK